MSSITGSVSSALLDSPGGLRAAVRGRPCLDDRCPCHQLRSSSNGLSVNFSLHRLSATDCTSTTGPWTSSKPITKSWRLRVSRLRLRHWKSTRTVQRIRGRGAIYPCLKAYIHLTLSVATKNKAILLLTEQTTGISYNTCVPEQTV